MAGFGNVYSEWLTGTWEQSRDFLKQELESLRLSIAKKWAFVFNSDNTLTAFAIGGDPTQGRRYVANTGPKFAPKWEKAVYRVLTDDRYISGGPILDVGTISATTKTASAVEEAKQHLNAGATF